MLTSTPNDLSNRKTAPDSPTRASNGYSVGYSADYSGGSSIDDCMEYPPDTSIDTASQSNILRSLRHSGHLSQLQVSEYLNISRQTYGRYEQGRYPMPSELWERLSHILPVPDFLILEDSGPCYTVNNEEKDLLTAFRQLDAEGRKQVLSLIRFEISWLKNSQIICQC